MLNSSTLPQLNGGGNGVYSQQAGRFSQLNNYQQQA